MPSTTLNNDIHFQLLFPDKLLFNLKPRTFGRICFVHILPLRHDKLSTKSLKSVFLGYSRHQKVYICYNPSLKKTLVTVDVNFFEDEPFYSNKTSSSGSQPSMPLPMSVIELPMSSSPPSHSHTRFADPPVVYNRRQTSTSKDSPPSASPNPPPPDSSQRFADPPLVYASRNKRGSGNCSQPISSSFN